MWFAFTLEVWLDSADDELICDATRHPCKAIHRYSLPAPHRITSAGGINPELGSSGLCRDRKDLEGSKGSTRPEMRNMGHIRRNTGQLALSYSDVTTRTAGIKSSPGNGYICLMGNTSYRKGFSDRMSATLI